MPVKMPRMLSVRSRVAVVAGVAAVAAAVAGCGASSNGASSGSSTAGSHVRTIPASAITRAADASGAAKGYGFSLSMIENLPNSQQFTIGGNGTYSSANKSGTANLTFKGEGTNLQMQEIIVGKTFYMKMPASVSAKLPGAKPWIELNPQRAQRELLICQTLVRWRTAH